jgi:hypothetical protein
VEKAIDRTFKYNQWTIPHIGIAAVAAIDILTGGVGSAFDLAIDGMGVMLPLIGYMADGEAAIAKGEVEAFNKGNLLARNGLSLFKAVKTVSSPKNG